MLRAFRSLGRPLNRYIDIPAHSGDIHYPIFIQIEGSGIVAPDLRSAKLTTQEA